MATLGTRAISRIPASAGGGVSQAKKIADLYASTHTNSAGDVSDPGVYDHIITNVLAPFAGTVDGQNAIADYENKRKSLVSKQANIDNTLAGLKLKEYQALYVDDDEADNTSFRNPAYVARAASESLDFIIAETVATIQEKEANGESTVELETYLNGLSKRADRMRSASESLEDGVPAELEGYGYFVDTDPNTGVIRGASFMPIDSEAKFADLADGKLRTDSMVTIGNKKVPLYLSYVKTADGSTKAMFGGTEYTGDTNGLTGGESDVVLADRTRYQSGGPQFQLGKVYRTFSGRTNMDGSPKNSYYYAGYDNKLYTFSDDDPNGKALLDSLKSVGAFSDIQSLPRLNPASVQGFATNPLPANDPSFVNTQKRGAYIGQLQDREMVARAESERLNNRGLIEEVADGFTDLAGQAAGGVSSFVGSFFGRKNRPSVPQQAPESRGGQYSAPDVLEKGRSFFTGGGG